MPLELKKQLDGTILKSWYGRFVIEGKRYFVNLGVKVAGRMPVSGSLKEVGDVVFERSRSAAQAKLHNLIEEARSRSNTAGLVEKIYEIRTGGAIESVKLENLADEWDRIQRRRKPSEKYRGECRAIFQRFSDYVNNEFPKVKDLAQVTKAIGRSFLDSETKRGIAGRTWNISLRLLRSACRHLLPAGAINPFSETPAREMNTVFRKPFSPEELQAIVEVVRHDDFLRPLIVTGICTAMRRGDCCLLKWKDIDLAGGFIATKTAKTGEPVRIPIFPLLKAELETRKHERGGKSDDFVFPEQARMYRENPTGITWRVKKVLAVALSSSLPLTQDENLLPEVSSDETLRRGLEFLGTIPNKEKRGRMISVFQMYMEGKTLCEVATTANVSKGSTSQYLNEIERGINCQIVRGRTSGGGLAVLLRNDSDLLRAKRADGKRRASVRDFHSFRVTWVTLALTAGVPLELVQKVTGHKTTGIVLKHYFQPGKEAFRQALSAAMPALLTGGQTSPKDEAIEILKCSKLPQAEKARLLRLVGQL